MDVPFKPGAGEEGAHLGDHYAELLEDRLKEANKLTALYNKHGQPYTYLETIVTHFIVNEDPQLNVMATQRMLNGITRFIRMNLPSHYDAESISEQALKSKPNNDDIRYLIVNRILTTKPFTSGH
ncbi:hypothetical protein CGCSCA1_v003028 [Colletotrichum siamense]|nr:hypothetical protein CGCSCA1_v003028 [Colletotrichum siamense]